jgi:hypothetical protein
MNVQNFLNTFIATNANKQIEIGVVSLTIYEESIRKDEIAVCRYNANNELEIFKPSIFFKKTFVNDEMRRHILNAEIKRIGLGHEQDLDIIINKIEDNTVALITE